LFTDGSRFGWKKDMPGQNEAISGPFFDHNWWETDDPLVAAFSSFRSIDISLKEHHAIMMIIPMSQTIRKKASWLIGLARLSNLKNIFLYKSRLVLII